MSKDNLPEKMLVHKGKKKNTYYYRTYVNNKRTKVNLGHDYPEALRKYHELEMTGVVKVNTLGQIWEKYKDASAGLLKLAPRTKKDYQEAWNMIDGRLGNVALSSIKSYHIRQWLSERNGKVRANREVALISILFNFATNYYGYEGYNPCYKIKRNDEVGRKKYIEKWEYEQIYSCADQTLKDILDLLLYTGQRVSAVLNLQMKDIKKNVDLTTTYIPDPLNPQQQVLASDYLNQTHADILYCHNNKTDHHRHLFIVGDFKVVMDRILERFKNKKVRSLSEYLIPNEKGGRLSRSTLNNKFVRARNKAGFGSYSIQMRDLRHKNATDDSLINANVRLAHTTIQMTEDYRDNVRKVYITPLQKLV